MEDKLLLNVLPSLKKDDYMYYYYSYTLIFFFLNLAKISLKDKCHINSS